MISGAKCCLWALVLACLCIAVEARADTTYSCNSGPFWTGGSGKYSSEAAFTSAFNAGCTAQLVSGGNPHYTGCPIDGVCNTLTGHGGGYQAYFTRDDTGPSGCIGVSASCTERVCGSGLTWDIATGACVTAPATCPVATIASGLFDMGTSPADPPSAVCSGGCVAVYSGASVSKRALVGGVYHYYAEGQYDVPSGGSANVCTTGAALPTGAPSGVPPDTCGSGQASGTVNGKTVCVDQTTQIPGNPNASPGASTTTRTVTPATPPSGPADTSGDGTVVTHSPGGTAGGGGAGSGVSGPKTTTTTTTTDPTTGVKTITTTVAPDDPVKSYCVEHPTADICKDQGDSTFGGTCAAFSCDGDAIQCAIALDQHKRNCTLFDTSTALSDLGNAAVAGTDSGTSGNPASVANRTSVDMSSAISQTRFLSSSCPADIVTTIAGRSFTLSFAAVCTMADIIGSLGVAVSLLIAAFIVFR